MAGSIPQDFIREIVDTTDIVSLIKKTQNLIKQQTQTPKIRFFFFLRGL